MLDGKNFEKRHPSMHPWTKRIMLYITGQMRWYPLQCEFKIYNERLKVGTAIDMICVEPLSGRLVFLEFKTGYKDYFQSTDGYMKKCLATMPNSPLNWANIQLTFAVIMLLRQNKGIALDDTSSYVIRIDDENLEAYHLDNRFILMMNRCLLEDVVV